MGIWNILKKYSRPIKWILGIIISPIVAFFINSFLEKIFPNYWNKLSSGILLKIQEPKTWIVIFGLLIVVLAVLWLRGKINKTRYKFMKRGPFKWRIHITDSIYVEEIPYCPRCETQLMDRRKKGLFACPNPKCKDYEKFIKLGKEDDPPVEFHYEAVGKMAAKKYKKMPPSISIDKFIYSR